MVAIVFMPRCVNKYSKTSSISLMKSQNLNVSSLHLQWSLPQSIEGRC